MNKGLSSEIIFQAAAELVAEKGYDKFSLRELASRLGVKPASIYSHVKNADEISTAVGMRAIAQLSEALEKASSACRMHFYQGFLDVLAQRLSESTERLVEI